MWRKQSVMDSASSGVQTVLGLRPPRVDPKAVLSLLAKRRNHLVLSDSNVTNHLPNDAMLQGIIHNGNYHVALLFGHVANPQFLADKRG